VRAEAYGLFAACAAELESVMSYHYLNYLR